jgi:UTP--glucose-1-phosphate uridylyltransferase
MWLKNKDLCVGVQQVGLDAIGKYCSLKVEHVESSATGDVFNVLDMIEKPKPEQVFSNYAILGRYVLMPSVF